jgi:hypothetical protein
MNRPLLPRPPLQVHPRKQRRLKAIALLLALPVSLPFLLGVKQILLGQTGTRVGKVLPPALLAAIGIGLALLVWRRLRHLRALGRDFVELHAPIVSRKEQADNEAPSGRITYDYTLERPPSLRMPALEGTIRVAIERGGPIFADERGNKLVVLASPRKARLFAALRIDGYPFLLNDKQAAALRHRMVEKGVALNFGRGLPNLASVARGLKTLLGAEASGKLPPRPPSGRVELPSLDKADPVIGVQRLARKVVRAFGFDPGTVLVTLRDDLAAAGQVEYEPGQGFYIDVRRELLDRPLELQVVLAHEVAHVFLAAHGLRDPDRFELEIQTDLAAALWGFGVSMVASHKNVLRRLGGFLQTTGWEQTVSGLGYLTPDECAYALAKLYDPRELRRPAPRHARRAFRTGARKARGEARLGLLLKAPLPHRLVFRLRRLLARWAPLRRLVSSNRLRFEPNKVVFACPHCTQQMRLPQKKQGTASCPNCRTELPFVS